MYVIIPDRDPQDVHIARDNTLGKTNIYSLCDRRFIRLKISVKPLVGHTVECKKCIELVETQEKVKKMYAIKIGDTVYQKKRGWSGVPMEVLEFREVDTPNGKVAQALCTDINGLIRSKNDLRRVSWFAVANLTIIPNSALK